MLAAENNILTNFLSFSLIPVVGRYINSIQRENLLVANYNLFKQAFIRAGVRFLSSLPPFTDKQ